MHPADDGPTAYVPLWIWAVDFGWRENRIDQEFG